MVSMPRRRSSASPAASPRPPSPARSRGAALDSARAASASAAQSAPGRRARLPVVAARDDDDGGGKAFLSIGELARRSGLTASTLRFYEAQGLIRAARSGGNQRQYPREMLRRVAFVRAAQMVGLPLAEITAALASLPDARTPTRQDWTRLSSSWRPMLEARIAELTRLRDQLTSCIGCGCLSLPTCALYNQRDRAASRGAGARYLLGDRPPRARGER